MPPVAPKSGLSWQIVPEVLGELPGSADEGKSVRAMPAMRHMRKLDSKALKRVDAGK